MMQKENIATNLIDLLVNSQTGERNERSLVFDIVRNSVPSCLVWNEYCMVYVNSHDVRV